MSFKSQWWGHVLLLGTLLPINGLGDIRVLIERIDTDAATPSFAFKDVPAPRRSDAAEKAVFSLVEGQRDIQDRKSTRLNSSHVSESRMPSSA